MRKSTEELVVHSVEILSCFVLCHSAACDLFFDIHSRGMSVRVRTAAAAAGRRLTSVRWTPSCLSARHVWLHASSFHTASSHINFPLPTRPSSPPFRHLSTTASASAGSAPPSSESELAAVQSMAELRDVVEHAGDSLVVLEWKAVWCGKCKIVAKELQRLQAKHPHITVRTADIEQGDLVEGKKEAGIDHIPVLHFIKGGELVHEIVGVRTNEMAKTVEKYAGEQSAATG